MAYSATVGVAYGSDEESEEEYGQLGRSRSDPSRSRRVPASSYVLHDVRKFERPIGQGRFGSVFRAQWQGIDVAIKQMSDDFMADTLVNSSGGMLGMEEEAALVFSLRHPNVVSMFGVWKDEGAPDYRIRAPGHDSDSHLSSSRSPYYSPLSSSSSSLSSASLSSPSSRSAPLYPSKTYMVMEYISGGDLLSLVRREGAKFSVQEKLHLLLEAARGMQYLAHRAEPVIHRDLACRNLLVWQSSPTDPWHVKVADFGLARSGPIYNCVRNESSVPLPMKWMAPEALFGQYSCASDVWSFGVVMWEVFTNGVSPLMIPVENLRCGTRLPQPQNCPDSVYNLMQRCWEYEADDRPMFFHIVQELEVLESQDFGDTASLSRSMTEWAGSAWNHWSVFERAVYSWIPNRRLVSFLVTIFLAIFVYSSLFAAEGLPDSSAEVRDWTPEQVVRWLHSVGPWVEPYIEEFAQYGIDGNLLLFVDENDLQTIGFPRIQANALSRRIAELREQEDPESDSINFWSFRSSLPLFTDQLVTGLQFSPRTFIVYQLVLRKHSAAFLPRLFGDGSGGWGYWLGWFTIPHLQVAHRALAWYHLHPILVTIVCIHAVLCTVTEFIALVTRRAHLLLLMVFAGALSMICNAGMHHLAPKALSDIQVFGPLVTAPLLVSVLFVYINLEMAATIRSRFFRFVS